MKDQQGASFLGFLAAITMIVVLGMVAVSVYTDYKEKTKVMNGVNYLLQWRSDVERCLIETQAITNCQSGDDGIAPPSHLDQYDIIDFEIVDGTIMATFDAVNSDTNTSPVKVAFFASPEMRKAVPQIEWTLYCNDYGEQNNSMIAHCEDNLDDMPDDLGNDWVEWKNKVSLWQTIEGPTYQNDWSPEADDQTSNYTQTRDYTLVQEQTTTIVEKNLKTGNRRVVTDNTEQRELNRQEQRQVSVNVKTNENGNGWDNIGKLFKCSQWEPSTDSAFVDETITQQRSCSQKQKQLIQHFVNSRSIHTHNDRRTLEGVVDTRQVSGTAPLWVAASDSVGDWNNTNDTRSYTDWTPSINEQESNFAQNRNFEQEQQRTITHREQNQRTDDYRTTGTTTETQYVDRTESRIVIVSIQSGDEGSKWSNTSGLYSCGGWSPARGTAYVDEQIEQTRQCSQDQEKVIEYTADDDIIKTTTKTRTQNNVTDTRTVFGTEPLWVNADNSISDWQWSEPRQYTNVWSPEVNGQTSSFEQSRDYERDRERIIKEREKNQRNNDFRVISTTIETDTQNGTETRIVDATNTGSGSTVDRRNCTNWSPKRSSIKQGKRFEQKRTCDQKIEQSYSYTVNENQIATDQIIIWKNNQEESRFKTGTKEPDDGCRYSRSNGYYISKLGFTEGTMIFPNLNWAGQTYTNPIFGVHEFTGQGTKSNPYKVIDTGDKFVLGEQKRRFDDDEYDFFTVEYEICKVN